MFVVCLAHHKTIVACICTINAILLPVHEPILTHTHTQTNRQTDTHIRTHRQTDTHAPVINGSLNILTGWMYTSLSCPEA